MVFPGGGNEYEVNVVAAQHFFPGIGFAGIDGRFLAAVFLQKLKRFFCHFFPNITNGGDAGFLCTDGIDQADMLFTAVAQTNDGHPHLRNGLDLQPDDGLAGGGAAFEDAGQLVFGLAAPGGYAAESEKGGGGGAEAQKIAAFDRVGHDAMVNIL